MRKLPQAFFQLRKCGRQLTLAFELRCSLKNIPDVALPISLLLGLGPTRALGQLSKGGVVAQLALSSIRVAGPESFRISS